MSIAGLMDPEINHNKSFHRRNDSGELDVFEAARYFSGYSEVVGYTASTFTQKMMREERHHAHRARISLDMPMRSLLPQQFHGMEKQIMKEKKHKQPSSPGGRLASFLNSLFSQSASKKKKSKSSSQSMKDEDESPGGRRRRRSSISHFRSASTADSKSLYSSLSSGFRTPPYVQTPTKSCKEFRTFSDHKHAQFLSAKYNNGHARSTTTTLQNELLWDEKKKREPTTTTTTTLIDDNSHNHKHKHMNGLSSSSSSEKQRNKGSHESVEKDRMLVEKEISEIRKFNEVDDGAESDSSSDLFELQNYDLGYYSSGLPVYETTNMDSIKRGAPISNGPL
ncbi:protein BIG GRAIN 1-like E [Vigna unguiculata]|uniref:Protein BIG GRAIN 1-like E n=1 Tax=Vigna unguiculata TaxID=3917 RepID=A0A4D6LNL1_VIGUN|nr:protein BIG GRAIN 1-like E [Vigna unguiculata]QCD90147.1 hypothetical protein DEO72_LG4g1101 [Vigna unguiculata]QCD90148.1 hypothetical protein DEO72_LG4g1102 [Vigna unguiculata]